MRVQELLDKLPSADLAAIRDAFENEYTFVAKVPDTNLWVGVNVPESHNPLAREGYYSYGEQL